jgi:cephalosporin-C deacetylase
MAFDLPLESLYTYTGSSPLPDDFEIYWQKKMFCLDDCDLSYHQIRREDILPDVECLDGYFTAVDGMRICTTLMRPKQRQDNMPGLAIFHGYTKHRPDRFMMLPYVQAGFTVLAMDCRDQGGATRDDHHGGPVMRGLMMRGLESGKDYLYLSRLYLDAAAAVRVLAAQDGVDIERIGVTGGSQGGTLSLVAAALTGLISFASVSSPFLCDFVRLKDMGLLKDVYEELGWYFRMHDPQYKREKEIFHTLGYVDLQNFTERIKIPVQWIMGLADPTCPPSTQFAAFNKLRGKKTLEIYPNHAHELFPGQTPGIADQMFYFLLEMAFEQS